MTVLAWLQSSWAEQAALLRNLAGWSINHLLPTTSMTAVGGLDCESCLIYMQTVLHVSVPLCTFTTKIITEV